MNHWINLSTVAPREPRARSRPTAAARPFVASIARSTPRTAPTFAPSASRTFRNTSTRIALRPSPAFSSETTARTSRSTAPPSCYTSSGCLASASLRSSPSSSPCLPPGTHRAWLGPWRRASTSVAASLGGVCGARPLARGPPPAKKGLGFRRDPRSRAKSSARAFESRIERGDR